MCSREEVSQVHELTVVLVLHVDDAPSVLSSSNLLAVNNYALLRPDHGEWNDLLDCGVGGPLLVVELIVVVWVHLEVMESELLLYALLECSSLLKR